MDEFDLLMERLKEELRDVAPAIAEEMKNIEQEVINEVVYNAYSPTYYERRYEDGGLSDKKNMKHDIEETANGFNITVKNITKGHEGYYMADGHTDGYIADIIEEGKGYGYGLDDVIGARPFNEVSQEVIDSTNKIENTIIRELKKRGW